MSTGLVQEFILFLQLLQKMPGLFQELRDALKDSSGAVFVVSMAGDATIGSIPHPGVQFGVQQ